MKKRWFILIIITLISGFWWKLGSIAGGGFILFFRPLILATLTIYLWRNVKDVNTVLLVMFIIAIAHLFSLLVYAIQASPKYITSDAETQLVMMFSLFIQWAVGLFVIGIHRLVLKK